MGWLSRKLGWDAKDPITYTKEHPEYADKPYWHPILVKVDKTLFHAFERNLAAQVADQLTDIEHKYGKVTESLIIELSTDELYVDAVVRIEPHPVVQRPKPQPQSSSQYYDSPPQVMINADGKIVEV